MSFAIIHSRVCVGITAPLITVEAHLSNGLPSLSIVGLPETAVKESKDRVRSALLNTHFEFPARRITINLAPADLRKEGSHFDLSIALGILAASQQIPSQSLNEFEFFGELGLSGELRPIQSALLFALATRKTGRKLIVPQKNAEEASLPGDVLVFGAKHLLDVCAHITGNQSLHAHPSTATSTTPSQFDMADVRGQAHAKRALEIAASGEHNILFIGPPGTGKTMLASRLPSILPPLDHDAALEVAAIASLSTQRFKIENWRRHPFRAPHHSASHVALVGGGNPPRPGEISLAHQGILFLDELPEFNRHALEALREPLEAGTITISRAARQAEFPARFQLIAAMNPCPCGQLGNPHAQCRCTSEQIQRYRARLSAPLLDRIDMHVEVPPVQSNLFKQSDHPEESSTVIQQRVNTARQQQIKRHGKLNSQLTVKELEQIIVLTEQDKIFIDSAIRKFGISLRAYHRLLRVARTIADLAHSDMIHTSHLAEAFSYRQLQLPTTA